MLGSTTLLWFHSDLRLADNPALDAAVSRGGSIVPVFIWATEEEAPWEPRRRGDLNFRPDSIPSFLSVDFGSFHSKGSVQSSIWF